MNHPDYFAVGDTIEDSPVGPGTITGITDAGYPRVNYVAVARLRRKDGAVFDPYASYAKDAARTQAKAAARDHRFRVRISDTGG